MIINYLSKLYFPFSYDKTEDLKLSELLTFSHIFVGVTERSNLDLYIDTHRVLHVEDVFSHVTFDLQQFPPIVAHQRIAIALLELVQKQS